MPSSYLVAGDYASYGVGVATTAGQVIQASVLVDTYLRRPEGLIYVADADGNPVWMKSLNPSGSFLIAAGLSPGKNVVATITGPLSMLVKGSVLVADKDTPATAEPLIVTSVTGNQVTFASVNFAHAAGIAYSAGLIILETRNLPANRPLMLLSKNPVLRLLAGQGRYGYGRRGNSNNLALNEFNLLAVMSQFGGPPMWENIDISHTDFNPETGQVWLPAGIMLAYYSEVRISYLSGFLYSTLPDIIKIATANIIRSQLDSPLSGNLKLIKAGDTQMERFLDTVLDKDTRLMLVPYRARTYA